MTAFALTACVRPDSYSANAPEVATKDRFPALNTENCWFIQHAPGDTNPDQLFCAMPPERCKDDRARDMQRAFRKGFVCYPLPDDCTAIRQGRVVVCEREHDEDCASLRTNPGVLPPGTTDLKCTARRGSRLQLEQLAQAERDARRERTSFLSGRAKSWDSEPCSEANASEAAELETGNAPQRKDVSAKLESCYEQRIRRCQHQLDERGTEAARACWQQEQWPRTFDATPACLDEIVRREQQLRTCIAMPEATGSEQTAKARCLSEFSANPPLAECAPLSRAKFRERLFAELKVDETMQRLAKASKQPASFSAKKVAATTAKPASSRCVATATKLIRHGKDCGIGMDNYNAQKICRYYFEEEKFTDEQAVRRLSVFMESCKALRAAVDGNRI